MKVPRKITVLIDDREKIPLLFPSTIRYFDRDEHPHLITVRQETRRLTVGDYLLDEDPEGCIIERKGSTSELCNNLLTQDKRRTLSAFRRLIETASLPVLLLDFALPSFFRGDNEGPPQGLLISTLFREISGTGLTLLCPGTNKALSTRTKLGEFLLHMMVEEYVSCLRRCKIRRPPPNVP